MENSIYIKLQDYFKKNQMPWERLIKDLNECDEYYSPLEDVDRPMFKLLASFCEENEIDYIEFIQYITIKETNHKTN